LTKISLTDILKNVMSFLERSGTEYMNWLNKLERKFGNWAIPNLIVWLIGAYTIGFVLYQVNPSIIGLLMLSPYHILHGQIWRLITWVFMPTDTNLVYLLIMALFYYQLGTTLERTWGTFRFNVYIFGGMLFTVIGAFLLYGIMYLMNGGVTTEMLLIGTSFSTSYINMSIFLAFACMYPDMQVLLMFIIPIKMKWMAAVYGVLIALSFFETGWAGFLCRSSTLLFSSSPPETSSAIRRTRCTGARSLRQTCEDRRDMRAVRSTSVLSAAGRNLTIRRWNSVSAPSARAITNTVRIICLHISIFG
jgi:hypothetical protein